MSVCRSDMDLVNICCGSSNIQVVDAGFSNLMKYRTDIFAFRYRCETFEILSNQWNITKDKGPRCTSGQCSQYGQGYGGLWSWTLAAWPTL